MANHDTKPLYVVVLAAGKGTRMKSQVPKVLHQIAGKPMIGHVLDTVNTLEPEGVFVITGHGADKVKGWADTERRDLYWIEQAEQLGTGHALRVALPVLQEAGVPLHAQVLIVSGDVPLTRACTLKQLVSQAGAFSLLTVVVQDSFGYGRILRDNNNHVIGVVEEKDATEQQRLIQEINTNVMSISMALLLKLVPLIHNDNAQREYYLPDLIGLAVADGHNIAVERAGKQWEVQGVNDRMQLENLERVYQKAQAQECMREGLGLADASRFDVRGEFSFGQDCFVDVNVVIEGSVKLGHNVVIGQNVRLKNVAIGNNSVIHHFCDIEDTSIGENCHAGPFARLRPGTSLADGAKLGNFVETKNTKLGKNAKINHLSYAGDCDIGAYSNIGAGTIFCNYDGANKHHSIIGESVFIGSNSSVVSPVVIGAGTTVGAGSTITKDIAADVLAVARSTVRIIDGWKRPTKQ